MGWILLMMGAGLAGQAGLAATVSLENGDRLTGEIIRTEGGKLWVRTEYAGELQLPWEAVTAIETDRTLYVGLKDGQVLAGRVSGSEGDYSVTMTDTGADTGTVTARKDRIAFVRSEAEQILYEERIERFRNPRLTDLWAGAARIGYSQAQGNSNTQTLNLGSDVFRATTRDKTSVSFTSVYARNDDAAGESLVTANAIRGGIRYSLNLSPRWFVFGSTDLEFDEFQDLDLRFAPAGGFGYKVADSERFRLEISGGSSMNREFFSTGLNRTSREAVLSDEMAYKANSVLTLRQKFSSYLNLTDFGQYRMAFDSGADTRLNQWLLWQISVSDRFLSNPLPGRERNDILLTTGIGITFSPE